MLRFSMMRIVDEMMFQQVDFVMKGFRVQNMRKQEALFSHTHLSYPFSNPMIHESIFEVKLNTLLTGLFNVNLAANVSFLFKKYLQRYLALPST